MIRKTDTIIIGGGQAGLSLSYYLGSLRRDHVVLERDRVGDQWLSRWDSLRLLTPNWLNRLHGANAHSDADGFLAARDFATYLRRYATSYGAPVYEHAGVRMVRKHGSGFEVETEAGTLRASNVVLATGHAAEPRLPALAAAVPRGVAQLHSSAYRNPNALPHGGVLVVGAGPSGQQIAAELARSGRHVVLAVGRHARSLRSYRGRDIWYWLRALGDIHRTVEELEQGLVERSASLTVSGANGGEQIDLAVLDGLGVTIAGRLTDFDDRCASFGSDLMSMVVEADLGMHAVLDRIDDHLAEEHPEWPHEADRLPDVHLANVPASIDLAEHDVTTIIWATGYRRDYGWLDVPALGANGEIDQRHGVSSVPGLYTLGLNFQRFRGSHTIGLVGLDAILIARNIADRDAQLRDTGRRRRWRPAPTASLTA